jgi:hypothetical protein
MLHRDIRDEFHEGKVLGFVSRKDRQRDRILGISPGIAGNFSLE